MHRMQAINNYRGVEEPDVIISVICGNCLTFFFSPWMQLLSVVSIRWHFIAWNVIIKVKAVIDDINKRHSKVEEYLIISSAAALPHAISPSTIDRCHVIARWMSVPYILTIPKRHTEGAYYCWNSHLRSIKVSNNMTSFWQSDREAMSTYDEAYIIIISH